MEARRLRILRREELVRNYTFQHQLLTPVVERIGQLIAAEYVGATAVRQDSENQDSLDLSKGVLTGFVIVEDKDKNPMDINLRICGSSASRYFGEISLTHPIRVLEVDARTREERLMHEFSDDFSKSSVDSLLEVIQGELPADISSDAHPSYTEQFRETYLLPAEPSRKMLTKIGDGLKKKWPSLDFYFLEPTKPELPKLSAVLRGAGRIGDWSKTFVIVLGKKKQSPSSDYKVRLDISYPAINYAAAPKAMRRAVVDIVNRTREAVDEARAGQETLDSCATGN